MEGVNFLNGLTNLRKLRLLQILQDNVGLDISNLTNLENLTIGLGQTFQEGAWQKDEHRDEDLACLAGLKRLRWLQGFYGIGDAGIKHLAGLTEMERLGVGGPKVTNDGLVHLTGMKKLKNLTLKGDITDEGLGHLESLQSLQFLNIQSESACSRAAVDRLRAALPNLFTLRVSP
jgi:hypothetical protein